MEHAQVLPLFDDGLRLRLDGDRARARPRPGPGTTELRGRPGTRLPHAWVDRNGARCSTLDAVGRGFTLIAGRDGAAWRTAAQTAFAQLAMPLTTLTLGVDLGDPERRAQRAFGIEPTGALLVRPDGIVAWRARVASVDSAAALSAVLAQLLDRAPPTIAVTHSKRA